METSCKYSRLDSNFEGKWRNYCPRVNHWHLYKMHAHIEDFQPIAFKCRSKKIKFTRQFSMLFPPDSIVNILEICWVISGTERRGPKVAKLSVCICFLYLTQNTRDSDISGEVCPWAVYACSVTIVLFDEV